MLGPVEVRRDGRRVAGARAARPPSCWCASRSTPGVPVRADRLVDDLWGADAVDTRRNTLQSKVARLRRALGDPAAIVSGDGGYALAVDPARSTRSPCCATPPPRRSGSTPATTAAPPTCARRRWRCYRGELLPAAGDWAAPHRARLEEARVKLVETQLSARAAARRAAT